MQPDAVGDREFAGVAESYATQELWAALTWQRRFDNFDGEVMVTDLAKYSDLWSSFLFTRPVYTPDPTGLKITNLTEILKLKWLNAIRALVTAM